MRNLTFLDIIRFKSGTGDDERFIPMRLLASELGLPRCSLLPVINATSGYNSEKKNAFQTQKNDELTDMIHFGKFTSLSVKYPSTVATIQFEYSLYQSLYKSSINSMNFHVMYLRKNLSGDHLSPTSDALVLHLRRASYQTFFIEITFLICIRLAHDHLKCLRGRKWQNLCDVDAAFVSLKNYY